MDEDIVMPCFRCGQPATTGTWIITGTKEGEARNGRFEAVCPNCYEILKEKERTRSRLLED